MSAGQAERPTVCGLPLEGAQNDPEQPIAALVVLKSFDPDGDAGVCYRVHSTDGLATVEALGMADYALEKLKAAIRRNEEES